MFAVVVGGSKSGTLFPMFHANVALACLVLEIETCHNNVSYASQRGKQPPGICFALSCMVWPKTHFLRSNPALIT